MPRTEKKRDKKNVSRKGGMLGINSKFHVPIKRKMLGTDNDLKTGLNMLYPLSLLYNKQKVPKDFSLSSDINADISSELNKYPVLKNIIDEKKLKEFFRTMFYNISTRKQTGGSGAVALPENRIALIAERTFPWKAYIAFFIGLFALCYSFYQAYLLNPRRHLNEFLEGDPNVATYIKVFQELDQYEPVDFYGIPYPNVPSIIKTAGIFALSVALEIAKNNYQSTLTRIVGVEQTNIPKKVFQYIKLVYFLGKRNLTGKVVEYSNRQTARSVGEIQDTIEIYANKVGDDINIGITLASVGITLITASTPFVFAHLKLLFTKKAQNPKIADSKNQLAIADSKNQLAIEPSAIGVGSSSDDDKHYNPMSVSGTLKRIQKK